jgi:hypothetical protein
LSRSFGSCVRRSYRSKRKEGFQKAVEIKYQAQSLRAESIENKRFLRFLQTVIRIENACIESTPEVPLLKTTPRNLSSFSDQPELA